MYKYIKNQKTALAVNTSYIGEPIEAKIRRILNNKEPISDGAPLIYTDRSEGVKPGYDIRTDRFDVAIEAMDKVTSSHQAKREERHKPKEDPKKTEDIKVTDVTPKKEGGA
jgi:hypothetical protein